MFEDLNTIYLGNSLEGIEDNRKTMVKVDGVTMIFNMASERLNSLKEYFIALVRRELRFKEFRALEKVSFEVKKGDVFGILGTNGSGKSTMLKIIAGVLEPSEGAVEVNGHMAPLIELGAGFDIELTARENIFLNGALLGYPKSFIAEHFDEIVEFAEIEKFLDMPLKNYSSGMVARIAFAIATVIVPEILIVDEVLSVGDFMFQQKCERRITDLIKNYGVTVLIVSHSNDQIERLCNKAIWIEKGHTRMMGTAQEVCSAYRVVGGREGTRESEQRVIDAMRIDLPEERRLEDYFSHIAGETRYSTAVDIADRYFDGQKSVIVTDTEWHKDCAMATSLAGLTGAMLLNAGPDGLPAVTEQMLKRVDPDDIIVVGPYDLLPEKLEYELRSYCKNTPLRLAAAGVGTSSLEVYEYGKKELGGWGGTAVIATEDSIAAYIALSRVVYRLKMPTFIVTEATGEEFAVQLAQTAVNDFERVIVLEGAEGMFDAVNKVLDESDADVLRFDASNELDACIAINNWIAEQRGLLGEEPAHELVFTTVWKPIDAYLLAPYLEGCNADIILGNPGSLDDTCKTFDLIERRGKEIESLVFLGGPARYSNDDRKALAKVLARARGEAEA